MTTEDFSDQQLCWECLMFINKSDGHALATTSSVILQTYQFDGVGIEIQGDLKTNDNSYIFATSQPSIHWVTRTNHQQGFESRLRHSLCFMTEMDKLVVASGLKSGEFVFPKHGWTRKLALKKLNFVEQFSITYWLYIISMKNNIEKHLCQIPIAP